VPARRFDAEGRARVDLRAVVALAAPLMANSAIQMVLNLTDTWFIGRLSTQAVAAVAAVHWLVIVVVMLFGGIGLAVQTVVAQSFGGRRLARASQAVWIALWGVALSAPLYIGIGSLGRWILVPFGLDAEVQQLAADFWFPRVAGSFLGAATWATLGFFNGIGQPRVTLAATAVMAVSNALFNQIFIFNLGWGIAGSGIATTVAQGLGLAYVLAIFLNSRNRQGYRSHLTWRLHPPRLMRQFLLGFPMGLLYAADLMGAALFQIMQVKLGAADGAATQIATMLTSIAYLPGVGIALAGTTLVGQSIGAGDRAWAMKIGNRVIALAATYMGGVGLLLALCGPWLMPLFTGSHDADSALVVALGVKILWFAAAYQVFDGVNLASGFCLRGAGDAIVPAALVLVVSWFVFVPLAHILTFAPGQGWVEGLPQLGWGVLGGWGACVIYLLLLGVTLFIRWRSGAWQRIRI
jgi:MATE family multidrug resistance protein